jgi:hypothetical protein
MQDPTDRSQGRIADVRAALDRLLRLWAAEMARRLEGNDPAPRQANPTRPADPPGHG